MGRCISQFFNSVDAVNDLGASPHHCRSAVPRLFVLGAPVFDIFADAQRFAVSTLLAQ